MGRREVSPEEQARKLYQIARLAAEELEGWHWYAVTQRQPFPGEMNALIRRAQQLRVSLKTYRSADAGRSGG